MNNGVPINIEPNTLFGDSAYYAVRQGTQCKVVGPAPSWQEAAREAFGIITKETEVKCLGKSAWYVRKRKWVQAEMNDKRGWFRPAVVDLLGINALGPPEVAKIMLETMEKIKTARWKEDAQMAHVATSDLLAYLPIELAAKYSDSYNAHLRTKPHSPSGFIAQLSGISPSDVEEIILSLADDDYRKLVIDEWINQGG